jgi:predicted enzyme related to lactoylglutathione lyase
MEMLVVVRADDPEAMARFYGALGLRFERERHGSGPEHHACRVGGTIFEIYPKSPKGESTTATRLGFGVPNVDEACERVVLMSGRIVTPPQPSLWGRRAVVSDPEGHRVELVEADRV